jgi:hypothetical protein
VAITGTGVPGSNVTVLDTATAVATTTVDAQGNWSASATLAYGPHGISATETNNGQTSAASNTVSGVVRPAAPTITAPAAGFDTTNTTAAVAGTGVPGAMLAISDGPNVVATTTVDAGGAFSASVSLGYGAHSLTATQTVAAETSAASGAVAGVVRPAAPIITSPINGFASMTQAVSIGGSGLAGAAVTLFDGATVVASVTADVQGGFSTTVTLAYGAHTLTATQTVNGETSAASAAVIGSVLTPAQITDDLIAETVSFGFQQSNNLLQNVLKSLSANNVPTACNQLAAFIDQVQAQSGKSLTTTEASTLVQQATDARAGLGCQ